MIYVLKILRSPFGSSENERWKQFRMQASSYYNKYEKFTEYIIDKFQAIEKSVMLFA